MIIARLIDTPQMLRDVESGPLDQAGHDAPVRNEGAESTPFAVISRHTGSENPN
jgi:hypothetical protein